MIGSSKDDKVIDVESKQVGETICAPCDPNDVRDQTCLDNAIVIKQEKGKLIDICEMDKDGKTSISINPSDTAIEALVTQISVRQTLEMTGTILATRKVSKVGVASISDGILKKMYNVCDHVEYHKASNIMLDKDGNAKYTKIKELCNLIEEGSEFLKILSDVLERHLKVYKTISLEQLQAIEATKSL